jgi:hypothetical protein
VRVRAEWLTAEVVGKLVAAGWQTAPWAWPQGDTSAALGRRGPLRDVPRPPWTFEGRSPPSSVRCTLNPYAA